MSRSLARRSSSLCKIETPKSLVALAEREVDARVLVVKVDRLLQEGDGLVEARAVILAGLVPEQVELT